MNEFELIERLTRQMVDAPGVVVGPGDDCAVLDLGVAGRWFLFKTDAVVEGVHFEPSADPRAIGHKALARCLSDVAAMGGLPLHAVVTLALPRTFEVTRVEEIYAGMRSLAERHGVALVGGETTTNPDRLLLSVALLGWVEPTRCVRRSGARPGDAIFVTGELGGSLAGRHLEFEPRIAEARWLTERFPIHSLIDVSDGLAGDLPHVLKASGVGAELLAEAIPVSRAARQQARAAGGTRPALTAALSDGEDFELLFTIASGDAVPLVDGWKAAFPGLRLSCIGRVIPGSELRIREKRGTRALEAHGYVHFTER